MDHSKRIEDFGSDARNVPRRYNDSVTVGSGLEKLVFTIKHLANSCVMDIQNLGYLFQ